MPPLSPAQRVDLFAQAAIRTGIHQPLLAALAVVHREPKLPNGETGLGISPANQLAPESLGTLAGQIYYAANGLRSLTQTLIAQGWQGSDFWNRDQGCYSDFFLQAIARGTAAPTDLPGAQLERTAFEPLQRAYLQQVVAEFQFTGMPDNQAFLEPALGTFGDRIPNHYWRFGYQRTALLELVRLWQGLDDRPAALGALTQMNPLLAAQSTAPNPPDPLYLDSALLQFLQQALSSYAGYPHQREALLRLVQGWQQIASRPATLLALKQGISPVSTARPIDSALIAFIQRLPPLYQGTGAQRHALVESFRQWHQLDNRPAVLVALGVKPQLFSGVEPHPDEIAAATEQVDRALLQFLQRIPSLYDAHTPQRAALIQLAQLWRELATPEQATDSLMADFQQLEMAQRDRPEAAIAPLPFPLAAPPPDWTLETLQLQAPILPNGSFTWAEATQGGLWLPPNQTAVDAIARMASSIQILRDRLDRPLRIISWYLPPQPAPGRFPGDRHALGDAILFYCPGLTAQQIYWFLDPWWNGGLGCYAHFPLLCYVDSRGDRVRWNTL